MSKKEVKFTEQSSYRTSITFICPRRGRVTEEVTVRKFTPQETPEVKSTDDVISDLLSTEIDIEEID